ncbi:hypothetical protein BRD13_00770 [Halobacteriales archaeon SW_5_70_135]|nr:MAG: hypothetical protein BRD13_00770 [Halobacteriales archaeon SW_5_70_135]
MSTQDVGDESEESDDGPGRREVAHRVFAAEYDDATVSYQEGEQERAPTYVVTPSGAKANRLFLVGVLTEVEQVNDEMLRARIVDPTGAFVVYAGQYQPEARATFDRAAPPAFVAVTGKARTFRPEDADRVYSSVRPESVNVVDADVRDRWVVETARATLRRAGQAADALRRDDPGDPTGGVALALERYGTTPAYLGALRDLAVDAAAVVAGDRDEVEPFDTTPDADRPGADLDALAALLDVDAVGDDAGADRSDRSVAETSGDESTTDTDEIAEIEADEEVEAFDADDSTVSGDESTEETEAASDDSAAPAGEDSAAASDTDEFEVSGDVGTTSTAAGDADAEADEDEDDIGDFEPGGIGERDDDDTDPAVEGGDEMYEMDDEERDRIESEYGTDFSTGTEVEAPGEADIETPDPGTDDGSDDGDRGDDEAGAPATDAAATAPEEETASTEDSAEQAAVDEDADDADEAETEDADDDAEAADVDTVLLERMRELDDGDGAERGALIEAVVDATGADAGAVEDAIQDALMSGQCYEPGEDRLKPI